MGFEGIGRILPPGAGLSGLPKQLQYNTPRTNRMRHLILLATALASLPGILAGAARGAAGRSNGGRSEGTDERLPGESRSCQSGRVARLVGLGRSGQRPLSNESRSRSHGNRCTQAEAQVDLWISRRQEHVFAALRGVRQSLRGE